MFFKSIIVAVCCLAVAISANTLYAIEYADNDLIGLYALDGQPILIRGVRSPDDNEQRNGGGSASFTYEDHPERGRNANLDFKQNLYTSDNGRYQIEAEARASRDFDHNRNDFGGYINGRIRF